MRLNILVIGNGAREHAIAKALQRSPQAPAIFCYSQTINPGILKLTKRYFTGDICDIGRIVELTKKWQITLAIIGPEAPLEKGLADCLWENNIPVIGPKKKLAAIETSKKFTRDLLKKYQIPGSLLYRSFDSLMGVRDFLTYLGDDRYVIKANGLMSGKGVKVAGDHLHSIDAALAYCQELLQQGQTFLIEEKIVGQEFSLLYFCDGYSLIPMPIIQDHKRAYIHDEGPNTGGMGSYSDADHRLPFLMDSDIAKAKHINESVLSALTQEYKEKYIGILYSSFMATKDGVRLIEYNARFGDPEAMNVLSILESDFLAICQSQVTGTLTADKVRFAPVATVCKYAVPEGYPDHPIKKALIDISNVKNTDQLYFGSIEEENGNYYTQGSRSVAFVGIADTLTTAEKIAEDEINRVRGKLYHRSDIGTQQLIQKRINQMRELRQ